MAVQFDRQYRLSAGQAGGAGFEVGATSSDSPTALHISFTVEKCDTETPNTANISLWNLNKEHLAILNEKDCVVTLRAGYGNVMPLIFVGTVTFISTDIDGGDRETRMELADGRVELRDTYLSLSYAGKINSRKVIENIAEQMGVALTFSYNATFRDFITGFSFVGPARIGLDRAVASSGLSWQIQNGILQVRKPKDTMTQEVFVLSPDSGLIKIPKKITYGEDSGGGGQQSGWEIEYLMNGVINIGDLVRLESKYVKGYFRVRSVETYGDNLEGDWICRTQLLQV